MGSVNKVILVGNLGRDAELRYTPGGAAVATLNLATTEVWNDRNNQRQEKTEWHRVVLWGKQAESLQEYLTKGKQIYVEGRLQTRQWDDKDGNKRYTTEIKADRITLLGGGGGGGGRGGGGMDRGGSPGAGRRAADGADHRRRYSVLMMRGATRASPPTSPYVPCRPYRSSSRTTSSSSGVDTSKTSESSIAVIGARSSARRAGCRPASSRAWSARRPTSISYSSCRSRGRSSRP